MEKEGNVISEGANSRWHRKRDNEESENGVGDEDEDGGGKRAALADSR